MAEQPESWTHHGVEKWVADHLRENGKPYSGLVFRVSVRCAWDACRDVELRCRMVAQL